MHAREDIKFEPLKSEEDEEETIEEIKFNENSVKNSWWQNIPCIGYILIFLKVVFHTGTNVMVKKMTNIHPLSLLLFRSLMILSVSLPWSVMINRSPFPPDQSMDDRLCLLFRGMAGCLNMWANFYSLRHLPFGDQKIIVATRPIFVSLSAKMFLKESCGLMEILSMVLMLSGIILVVQPPIIFQGVHEDSDSSDPAGGTAAIFVLLTTILASNITVIIRRLRKDHVATLTATNQLIIVIESFFLIFLFGIEMATPEFWEDRMMVVMVSLGNMAYVILEMLSLKVEEANKVSLLDNSFGIILAFAIQVVIFEDVPSFIKLGGTVLVFLSVLVILISKMWTK